MNTDTSAATPKTRYDDGARAWSTAAQGRALGPSRTREAIGLAVVAAAGWSAALWVSTHVQVDPALHTAALFAHLACLVAGFGAALTVDYFALLWLLGRRTLRDVLLVSGGTSLLVWTGLAGLVASGALLSPNLHNGLTQLKLGLVLMVALNGAFGGVVHHRLQAAGDGPPRSVLGQGVAAAAVSQAGWWGAAVVGFLNSQC